ncbi:MAG: VCBS repeat-containing protein, partial [Actinomycetota bacterium]|nr:VCBS repeat-containing protein [Actinomycetota bacterium]
MINETYCGTKNDLETPPDCPVGSPSCPTTVGKEPETGGGTGVGTLDPNDPNPSLVTGGETFPHTDDPDSPWSENPTSTLPGFESDKTTSVTVVDVNGDGIDDVIVTTDGDRPSKVYINPGDGDFSGVTPTDLGPPGQETPDTSSVKVADVNGDGVPDIIVGNEDGPNHIYLGDPSNPGVYEKDPLTFGLSDDKTTDVEVVDVDGDGALDIVVANDGQPNRIYYGDPNLEPGKKPSYGSDPDQESTIGSGSGPTTSVEVVDLNGDDRVDIVFGNDGERDEIFYGSGATGTRTDLSDAQPTSVPGTESTRTTDIKVGDVTGDGIADIVIAVNGEPNLLVEGHPYDGFRSPDEIG